MSHLRIKYPELAKCVQQKAIKWGDFTLSNGERTRYYCDGKMVSFDPEGISLVVEAILNEIDGIEFDAVGGMDMGATPILSALALRSLQLDRSFPTFVVRKERKPHGSLKEIEGPVPPALSKVVIVDDVVTTGGSIEKAIRAARRNQLDVVLAICILDRESGGEEQMKSLGIPYRPLLRWSDLEVLQNEESQGCCAARPV
ncbi:MAG: orotate phosphoribosyltransferase [Planctomycetes bacterium]|nr:orotate phosphoribosyltransferase [Planctomycetota bacterium]